MEVIDFCPGLDGFEIDQRLGWVAGGNRRTSSKQILRCAQDFGARLRRRAGAETC